MKVETNPELFGVVEEKGIDAVTLKEAHGSPRSVFGLWMAANIEFANISTAGALATGAFGLPFAAAFVSILIASIAASTLLAIPSTFGVDYGRPQHVSRGLPGLQTGNKVPSSFNFFCGISWFAVNTTIGAYAAQYFLGRDELSA